jgi:hypothetical protein
MTDFLGRGLVCSRLVVDIASAKLKRATEYTFAEKFLELWMLELSD